MAKATRFASSSFRFTGGWLLCFHFTTSSSAAAACNVAPPLSDTFGIASFVRPEPSDSVEIYMETSACVADVHVLKNGSTTQGNCRDPKLRMAVF